MHDDDVMYDVLYDVMYDIIYDIMCIDQQSLLQLIYNLHCASILSMISRRSFTASTRLPIYENVYIYI